MAKALNPQSALPSSESSVHERLLALESKQLAYRSLSNRLLQLPRKLSRRALVPVGPRLYLPGELVRTNEILVLLGSAGEATYFAERSAWQAHEIVRRRLGRVERGLRELLDEGDGGHNVGAPFASNVRVEAAGGAGNNVTDAKTIYGTTDAVPHAQEHETGKVNNDTPTGNKTVLSRGIEPVSVLKTATSKSSPTREKKKVRFSDPLIHPSLKSTPQPCFISPPKSKTKSKKKKSTASSSSSKKVEEPDLQSTRCDAENGSGKPISNHHGKADKASRYGGQSKSTVLDEFRLAVENAQKQVLGDGIVNITEIYEGEEETPSRVELPPGFEPDKSVSFAGDSEDFLDMTGADDGVEDDKDFSREDYLDALAEVERESQAEEERVAAEKRRNELEREKKEFGKGLAKGFFGAAPKKRTQAEQQRAPKGVTDGSEVPSTQVASSSSAATVAAVVERKPSRKARRRNRRPRSNASAFPPSTPTAVLTQDTLDRMEIEALDDDGSDHDEAQTSMFLKLRSLRRDAVGS